MVTFDDFNKAPVSGTIRCKKEIINLFKDIPNTFAFKTNENDIYILYKHSEEAEKMFELLRRRFILYGDKEFRPYISYMPHSSITDNIDDMLHMFRQANRSNEMVEHHCIIIDKAFRDRMMEVQKIEKMVNDAIENNRIEVYYQPIYSTEKHIFTSAEALVRIRDDKGKIIPPATFIEIAERNGTILKLGEIIFENVCTFIETSDVLQYGLEYIEVNLSVVQCEHEDLAKEFIEIMRKHNISGETINLEITEQIKHHITRMGAVCNVYDQYNRNVTSIDIPEGTQCILVIGGDGTILAAARMLVGNTIPLLGINLGTLGFLADVNLADLSKTLDLLLKDQYQVENRIMLTAEVYKQGEKAATYIALNDFNINRCGASRVIGLKVGINGSTIDCYRADGVIVCTPTGSTGYNLSAGGPIINPTCKNFVITPICPHSLTARSIVLAKEDVVTVEVEQIRSNIKEEAIISFDGREGLSIVPGDQVKIYKSQEVTPFIKATEVSFVQILKEKLL